MRVRPALLFALVAVLLACCACSPRVSLFGRHPEDPLRQDVLEGKGRGKVLALPVSGFISAADRGAFSTRPGLVRELSAILRKAATDKDIKAVVLLVDSPGGTVAGTDMLRMELEAFRAQTGAKAVAQAMTVCASGGYFLALGADEIWATPASVVGSVGTVFISPKLAGLMEKIGVGAEVTKSGSLKDMGSPFRPSTEEEKRLAQQMIDQMNALFLAQLDSRRSLSPQARAEAAKGGVFTGTQAASLGLVDRVGYPREAFARARELAGLPPDAKVVVYRRQKYRDDTWYNAATAGSGGQGDAPASWPAIGLESLGVPMEAGFYYLWPQSLPQAAR